MIIGLQWSSSGAVPAGSAARWRCLLAWAAAVGQLVTKHFVRCPIVAYVF